MTKSKGIFVIAIMIFCVVALSAPTAMARSSQVNIASTEVDAGKEFTVKVVFKGANLGRVDAVLDYDKEHLEYVSGGTSNGDNGSVQLKLAGEGGNIKFKLRFIAKKAGKTKLKISDSEIYDLDEQLMDSAHGTGTVTITGEAIEEDTSSDQQQEKSSMTGQEDESADEQSSAESDGGQDVVIDEDPSDQTEIPWVLVTAATIVAILLIVVIVTTSAKRKKK